ncbi:hypothetical protein [Sporosarcina sp. Te-1]|uniref:hypothetical protein n=1 Tax=Sporosarcina sp. Te-1 TaxID=2818390 RepID=UPI001A9FB005|nr:hypothetical protein [Sporosarcina sp. Te-1]QTD42544.1 hypothetical protein J3U78_06980 [Sporosarcina sp. Te-1]
MEREGQEKKDVGVLIERQDEDGEFVRDENNEEGTLEREDSKPTLNLSQKQKEEYYKQYVEIVNKVNEKKMGLSLGVEPMKSFKESDWQAPEDFEAMIQQDVEGFLAREREVIAAVSTDLKPGITDPSGVTTKQTYIYIPDSVKRIEVTAKFNTRLDSDQTGQIFSNVDTVTSELVGGFGTWEQTSMKSTLLDDGRTYHIYIEGKINTHDLIFEKAFAIEFECDGLGNVF